MKFHHIAISVEDLQESIKFYVDHFGFEIIRKFTKDEWDGSAAILELEDIKLELFHFNDHEHIDNKPSNLHITGLKHFAFEVEDIETKYEELESKDVDIDEPKPGTTCSKFCFLRDLNGILIELYQE